MGALTPDELEQECAGNWNRALAHAPVSVANERWAAMALRSRLARLLDFGGASLEEDRAAVAEADDGMRRVLQLRLNGKVVVASVVELLDTFLEHEPATGQPP